MSPKGPEGTVVPGDAWRSSPGRRGVDALTPLSPTPQPWRDSGPPAFQWLAEWVCMIQSCQNHVGASGFLPLPSRKSPFCRRYQGDAMLSPRATDTSVGLSIERPRPAQCHSIPSTSV